MELISPGANNYDWGKPGKTSAVANFAAATHDGFTIEEEKPYAEVCTRQSKDQN
jgi:hypothetical protein